MNSRTPLWHFLSIRYWPTWIGLGVLRLFAWLPTPLIATLGYGFGMLFYWLIPSRRKISHTNIASCFPNLSAAQVDKIVRSNFRYTGHAMLATPLNWWIPKRRFNALVEVEGQEHLDKAVKEGRNIILLAPHFVSLEVCGLRLVQEYGMSTMYQYAKNRLMDEIIIRGRTRYGGVMIERKAPMRQLVKTIKSGMPFKYLPDQDAGRKGIFVPFYHELASTIPMLALKSW